MANPYEIPCRTAMTAMCEERQQIVLSSGGYIALTLLAFLYPGNALLELIDVPAHRRRGSGPVAAGQVGIQAGSLHIQPGSESAVARSREYYSTYGRVVGQFVEDAGQLMPHILEKGVQLLWPVDLDMGHVLGRRGHEEVLEAGILLHG